MPLPLSFVNKIKSNHQSRNFNDAFFLFFAFIQESHLNINPFGIVAIGPDVDFNKPHDRATRFV